MRTGPWKLHGSWPGANSSYLGAELTPDESEAALDVKSGRKVPATTVYRPQLYRPCHLCSECHAWACRPLPAVNTHSLAQVALYHIPTDEGERINVASKHPAVVRRRRPRIARYTPQAIPPKQ